MSHLDERSSRGRFCLVWMVALLVLLSLPWVGCRADRDQRTIKLAYVNWADAVALTYLAQAILEDHLGYEVRLTMADAAPVFTSVADGGHDAFLDAWLPITHAAYIDRKSVV